MPSTDFFLLLLFVFKKFTLHFHFTGFLYKCLRLTNFILTNFIYMNIINIWILIFVKQSLPKTMLALSLPVVVCSISAQSNFAVGAVVNATFGSITELTFYITALLRGHYQGTNCLEEIVKAALTGTLLGCILFIPVSDSVQTHLHIRSTVFDVPLIHCLALSLSLSLSNNVKGICMIIGGLKHREQRFNSRSAGVSSSLLFISVGGEHSFCFSQSLTHYTLHSHLQ